MPSLQFDHTLQQYYYITSNGDISFDSPKEVKINRKCNIFKSKKFSLKKLLSIPSKTSLPDLITDSDSVESEKVLDSDSLVLLDTDSEFKIFSHDYEYDSDLVSIDSDLSSVHSFNGHYNHNDFSKATENEIDYIYNQYYHGDYDRSGELNSIRRGLLKQLDS